MFVRAAARSQRAALDDDYTLDDSFVDRSVGREDAATQGSRDRMQAIMVNTIRCLLKIYYKHLFVNIW